MNKTAIAIFIFAIAIITVLGIVFYTNPTIFQVNPFAQMNPTVQQITTNPDQWVGKNVTVTGTLGYDVAQYDESKFQVMGGGAIWCLTQTDSSHMNTYVLDLYPRSITSTANSYLMSKPLGSTVTVKGHLEYITVVASINATLWVDWGSFGIPPNKTWSCYAFVVTAIP